MLSQLLRCQSLTENRKTNNCFSEEPVTSKRKNTCLEFSSSQAMPSREIWFGQFLKEPFSQGTSESIFTFFSPNLTTPNDATQNAKVINQYDM